MTDPTTSEGDYTAHCNMAEDLFPGDTAPTWTPGAPHSEEDTTSTHNTGGEE